MPEAAGQDGTPELADPLAIRLALMMFAPDELAHLTDDVLIRAGETLTGWRRLVAEWAQSPSKPVSANLSDAARAASGDLDAVSVITLLRSLVTDDSVRAGARFETFLYADRLLGLELPRDIGRLNA
jgi:hypothetical protein